MVCLALCFDSVVDTVLQLGGAFDRAPTCLSTSLEGISQTTTVT
jgi:hypothetical protein